MQVKAKIRDNDRVVTVDYPLGEDLDQLTAAFGSEAVYSRAKASFVIDLQAIIRSGITSGKTDGEIQGLVSSWKPGVRMPSEKLTPQQKLEKLLGQMSPEDRKAFLKSAVSKRAE